MTHPNLFKLLLLAILAAMLPQLASSNNPMFENGDNGSKSAISDRSHSTSTTTTSLNASSLQTIQIGNGSERSEALPVFNWWKSSYTGNECLYVKDNLNGLKAGDKIVSLSYNCIQGSAYGGNFNVRIKNTTKSTFNSNDNASDVSIIEVGYNDNVYGNVTLGSYNAGDWIVFNLNEPFVYNGQNIIIDIRNTAPAESQGWCYFACTEYNSRRSIYWRNANSENVEASGFHSGYDPYGNYDSGMYLGESSDPSLVPNVRITYIPSSIEQPSPVDLGVSVKWASINVGATSPEQAGGYYAWGEIAPKATYYWSNYMCDSISCGTNNDPIFVNGLTDISGTIYDAAKENLGPNWRTPTKEEWDELISGCNWTQTNVNGIHVWKISNKSNSNNFIYLPFVGYMRHDKLITDQYLLYCGYQSSTQNSDKPWEAYVMASDEGGWRHTHNCQPRFEGYPVRAVYVESIFANSISLSPTSLSLVVGESSTLTATISPSNVTNGTVTWTSTNTSVATVDGFGTVTAKAAGTTTIKATTTDGTNLSASCSVTVTKAPILATSITISPSQLYMVEGDEAILNATVLPNNTDNPGVLWSSSNQNVATVNSSGKVTAKSEGTATITAKTVDGSNLTSTCQVTVNEEDGWAMLTPDFNKTIMFKKFRIKPNATGSSNYVGIRFSPLPNEYAELQSCSINSYTGWFMIEPEGQITYTSSMTDLGNGWFEYEYPSYLCFYNYERNVKWGTVKVFVEYPGTIYGDVNGDGNITAADITAVYNILLGN